MKNIISLLYSTRLMSILFVVFATAMGIATFIENDYGTQTSKALVYNTWWFEAIMVVFVINFVGNIFRYRLHKKEKWPVLLFHLAFILIILGAGVTRYIGHEGIMIIDEGETTNKYLSETTYVNIIVDDANEQKTLHKPTLFSAKGGNSWELKDDFRGKEFSVTLTDYIPWAERKFVEDENGKEHLFVVESSSGNRHEHYIEKGTIQNVHGILVGFDADYANTSINIFEENGELKVQSKMDGSWMRMADQKQGEVKADTIAGFQMRSLYRVGGLPFVVPEPVKKGAMKLVRGKKDDSKLDIIQLDVTVDGNTEKVELLGGKFNTDNSEHFHLGGLNFRLLYGARALETPFQIKLNDFQLEKYPGSESAASYASEITVVDGEDVFDFKIFMNNILNHKGYRFFQASYNLSGPVEQTHLSVNHDSLGTIVTYIGYSLLYLGLIVILFAKNTRFYDLKQTLQKIKTKKAALSLVALFTISTSFAQETKHSTHTQVKFTTAQIDSILQANLVDLKHAEEFNKLVIQDGGGRMKPAHTFASELVRKVSQSENFKGMEPSQVFISIIENPRFWFEVPFVYLEKENLKIREDLGLAKDVTHASLSDFFTIRGDYKIREAVAESQKKKIQNKYEKDLIKIDRRVGLFYSAIGGGIFRIFPIPDDENNTWVSQPETLTAPFKGTDSVFVKQSLPVYIQLLQSAKQSGDYTEANKLIDGLKRFQQKFGAEVYPTEKQIELEILYNKLGIFKKLSKYYGFASLILMIFVLIQIFNSKKWVNLTVKILLSIIILLFITHTLGLVSRWYISGNAPWSNAYESLIYVAWALMLFGFIVGKRSALTITATAFLTAIILAFAHQNWLDPEIANLQPVLNSYWLLVHVSIIVASYGPFSLGMILGILALFLTIFSNKKNKKKMELHIKELTAINEMALTIGLVMLTIGNFLGGMWANESWGRYWGWDPKETWALISIMVYAFVLHMRLVPGLRGRISFNFASALAYLSIMMTYFGVNFYLSGLHSYASGDQQVTPREAYYYLGFIIIMAVLARYRNQKLKKSSSK